MREYIQMLIWTMLFVIVVEMIFPDTDFKKYIKLIIGILIIYIVFSPLLKIKLLAKADYKGLVTSYQKKLNTGSDEIYETAFKEQQQKLLVMRQEQSEREIKQVIEKKMDLTVLEVGVDFSEHEDTWVPEEISLVVAHGNNGGKGNKSIRGNIVIPTIKIGEKDESIVLDQNNLENEIKSCLKDFYNVDNFNIYITVQENVYKGDK